MDGILSCAGGALFERGETVVPCRHMQSAIPSTKGKNRHNLIITSWTDVLRQQEILYAQFEPSLFFDTRKLRSPKEENASNLMCLRYKILWNDAIGIP